MASYASDKYYIYGKNDHDYKIYKIPLTEFESDHSQYDAVLHSIKHDWISFERYRCMYCDASFESRNKLFQHLGFMNVNISKNLKKRKYDVYSLEDQLADLLIC
jgi:hypothetical protein